ncbi:MAG TPA: CpsB/CapC family capsule biosynthesis tyrosine phosphatase [Fimbriiglobus sp.]|jgi:protein-tyrosine phosphatase
MIPLVDTHVHLFAGRDDGPSTMEEAVAMCRMLASEGARSAAALAHQNKTYPENTPDALRAACADLDAILKAEKIPLTVLPTAEVMAASDLVDQWVAGQLLSVADLKQFLLVEQPHGIFLDLRPLARALRPHGVRIIVAHAERYQELLFDTAAVEELIRLGCLIQVTSGGLTRPGSGSAEAALKDWIRRGMVHLLGSDGHGLDRRPPRLREGHRVIARWTDEQTADRIGGIWGSAVMQGRPVNPPMPKPKVKSWFAKLTGG